MVIMAERTAARIRPYVDGRKYTELETLALIKNGANVTSHTNLYPLASRNYRDLPEDVKSLLHDGVRTSTFFVNKADGEKLGEKVIARGSHDWSLAFIVPKIYQDLIGGRHGLAADLTANNFGLIISWNDNKQQATIDVNEGSLVRLDLVQDHSFGKANESTLWIPAKEVKRESRPTEEFRFSFCYGTGLITMFYDVPIYPGHPPDYFTFIGTSCLYGCLVKEPASNV